MKRLAALSACVVYLAALISCGKAPVPPKPEGASGRYRIAVIPKGANQVYWKSVHAGAVKAGRELGVDVIWKGPLKEDDRESQIKVMEDFIAGAVNGIVLAPLDDTALRPAVHAAVAQGIPVVIIDSALNSDRYVSFVATDNYAGGRKAAGRMAELLHDTGRVIVFRFLEGSASTEQRVQGFLDGLKERAEISVVSSSQRSGATAEVAYQNSENLLAQFKKPGGIGIDGIFCPNEFTTFAMLRALQDSGLAGKVKFVGFDSSEMLVNAMKKGEIHGLVLQDPITMGYLGVRTMVQHLNRQQVERRIDTGSTVATPENMNQAEVRQLLEPDYRKWLGEER